MDDRAFIEAYDEYADAIFRYCLVRVRDREVAHDLMQETFTKTWGYLQAGNEIENLRAFLYKVAHNTTMSTLVKTKSDSLDALKEEQGYDPKEEQEASPEDRAEQSLMMKHLEQLDEASRDTLVLRYMNGLPVKEIAVMRGEEPGAVSVRIHRALKTLQEKMRIS